MRWIGEQCLVLLYNASKAAVRLMTKSVAVQHAKDKIRANSVHPGVMPPMRSSGRTADPAVRAERMRVIPMRRPGDVDEVAYAILFLASELAAGGKVGGFSAPGGSAAKIRMLALEGIQLEPPGSGSAIFWVLSVIRHRNGTTDLPPSSAARCRYGNASERLDSTSDQQICCESANE
jgi:hypothetical protein